MSVGAAFAIQGSSYVRIGDTATPTTATADDDLFVEGVLETGNQATVSGNLTLAGAARSIQTTANNTLTLGGGTTGNIVIDSGSNVLQLSDATINLTSFGEEEIPMQYSMQM